jgi:hypothetical protein
MAPKDNAAAAAINRVRVITGSRRSTERYL